MVKIKQIFKCFAAFKLNYLVETVNSFSVVSLKLCGYSWEFLCVNGFASRLLSYLQNQDKDSNIV